MDDTDLAAAAAELQEALDAAHVTARLKVDERGWIDVQLWGATEDSPAPGLISALQKADDYLVSRQGLVSASVYAASARWLAEGLRGLVASGRAPR